MKLAALPLALLLVACGNPQTKYDAVYTSLQLKASKDSGGALTLELTNRSRERQHYAWLLLTFADQPGGQHAPPDGLLFELHILEPHQTVSLHPGPPTSAEPYVGIYATQSDQAGKESWRIIWSNSVAD